MPIPAVTLRNRATQRNQNCGVRIALRTDTLPFVCIGFAAACEGSKPFGAQSGWGTRMTKAPAAMTTDRKSTRLNSSHVSISYAVFCSKKKIMIKVMIIGGADNIMPNASYADLMNVFPVPEWDYRNIINLPETTVAMVVVDTESQYV